MRARLLCMALAGGIACGPADSARDAADSAPDPIEAPRAEAEPLRTDLDAPRAEIEPVRDLPVVQEDPDDAAPEQPTGEQGFPWRRGWYTDGRSDWYTVRDDGRVLMSTATVTVDPDSTIRG